MMGLYVITACFILISGIIADQSLNCDDWEPYKDEKCFKVFNNKHLKSFDEANHTCYQLDGSTLMSIRSQEEQEFLFNLLNNVYNVVNNVWLGIEFSADSYKWTDSTPLNYTNWANGNPINESGYDCVQLVLNQPYNGQWFNKPCNLKNVVVCEKKQNWMLEYLQKTVMEMRDKVSIITSQLESSKSVLNDTKNKLETTESGLEYTQNQLESTRADLVNTTNQLESAAKDLQNTKYELDITKNQLEITKSNLESTKTELQNEIIKVTPTPAGTIAYFARSSPPLGWLKANGQVVSRTTYSNLFASIGTTFGSGNGITTFTLPDLRGEFIRGWSDGRDVDSNRAFGSFQWGSSIPYVDSIAGTFAMSNSVGMAENRNFAGTTFDGGFQFVSPGQTRYGITFRPHWLYYSRLTTTGTITYFNVLQGTRPRNIAMLACIKY